jgi:hypothetical protein
MMSRFRLIFLGADIAGFLAVAFIVSATPAQAKQCSAERPPNARSYWSYRLIDGRKCWYEGKPMLAKSELHWPTSRSSQTVARPESDVVPANQYNLLDAQASIADDSSIAATPRVSAEGLGASAVPTPSQTLTPDHLRTWANSTAAMTTEQSITKTLERRLDEELPQQRNKPAPVEDTSLLSTRVILAVSIAFMALLALLMHMTLNRRPLLD